MWTQALVRHAFRTTRSKLASSTLALPKVPAVCAPSNVTPTVASRGMATTATAGAAAARMALANSAHSSLLPLLGNAAKLGLQSKLGGTATPAGIGAGLQAARRCMSASASPATDPAAHVKTFFQMAAGVAAFLAADKALKQMMAHLDVTFPAPLIGMFAIFTGLCSLSALGQQGAADAVVGAMRPALRWVQRWLPLFYVIGILVLLGMPITLFATARLVMLIRSFTSVTMLPMDTPPGLPPFNLAHLALWGALGALGLAGTAMAASDPTSLEPEQASAATTLFLLSSTIGGLLVGSGLAPPALAAILPHPVIVTAAFANAACLLVGHLNGSGYFGGMKEYLTKGKDGVAWGAGDWLMSFLGVVVLSFGFHIYGQRGLLMRHKFEVLGCAAGSALFSLVATVAGGRLIQLPAEISLALSPRSVTVALAMPMAEQLGVPPELIPVCAAAVVMTGLIGAATCQRLLNLGGFVDPVTRGLATAGSCHGLGTAALAAKEPAALPFCALAYGLIGIAGTVWASLPPVKAFLRMLAGAE
eukprot:CAMPEP_0198230842 /NCGR_PEP_ID=MMETSP1445-20131203/114888_1 /TAXON_ID=36898 /ORGANISM="Pyramimonas sp., Strain CCMP2087" /LENGTH=532 /DNA_ID=CAMNT_0043911423 /DNA_START=70 /DNA_END=1668 /DNA_ORIENTATION=-